MPLPCTLPQPATRVRRARGRLLLAPLVCTTGLLLTACGGNPTLAGDDAGASAQVLVVSDTWLQGNQGAESASPARIASLQGAIEDLRTATGSGWVGRQDDQTGYLAELTGGGYAEGDTTEGTIASLLEEYGGALFGIGSDDVALEPASAATVTGVATVRATQQVGDVPVLDGQLVFNVSDTEDDPRLGAVRGRVFPALQVATQPRVPARRAARIAARLAGGQTSGRPELVVVPTGEGQLAWQITVVGAATTPRGATLADGLYFIDAVTGDLVSFRPASAEGRLLVPGANRVAEFLQRPRPQRPLVGRLARLRSAPADAAVEVTGTNPIGGPLTAVGLRTAQGVELVDTTVPTWDDQTREGGIFTYDATRVSDDSQLPGELYVSGSTTIADSEALGAHAASRAVYDYYASLGRASWDGQGASLVSSVNYGPSDFCNSFFSSSLTPPQMVYGNPCTTSDGQQETTEAEIDTAGHEITHGVIDTSADLTYSGQSGALNESFADYFGNVIGNQLKDIDTASVFEGSCAGITTETVLCTENPDGSFSLRYMLNDTGFDDYLRILDVGYRFYVLGIDTQDHGGVHSNSAIWNNALWSIRTRLAQIEGTDGNSSQLAGDFDKIVYAALTTQLTPTSGFFDAREAIEQTITASGADPLVLRTAREIFDQLNICPGCSDIGVVAGDEVTTASQTQLSPVVSGDQIAWLDLSAADPLFGLPSSTRVGGTPSTVGSTRDTVQVAYAGDALLTLDTFGTITRYDGATGEQLTRVQFEPAAAAGLVGSDQGAAWISGSDSTVNYVDAEGEVTSAALSGANASVTALGTGGGTVALGTDGGEVLAWTPGGQMQRIGSLSNAVLSIASYGDRVIAVDYDGNAAVFDAAGNQTDVSTSAAPFGAAMNDDYAIWTEAVGGVESAIFGGATPYPDTDLFLYSFATGAIYNLMDLTGQQGFPTMSGDRIVWQDAAFGGDDILTATVPSGL